MEARPAARALFLRNTLEHLEVYPRGQRVLRRLSPDTVARAKGANAIGWLPLEMDLELDEAVLAELGRVDSDTFWRRNMLHALDTPLMAELTRAAVRMMGVSPPHLIRFFPKAWRAFFRNVGELRVLESDKTAARVTWERIPVIATRTRTFPDSLRATFTALYDFARVRGAVEIESLDLDGGRVVYTFAWQPRR